MAIESNERLSIQAMEVEHKLRTLILVESKSRRTEPVVSRYSES